MVMMTLINYAFKIIIVTIHLAVIGLMHVTMIITDGWMDGYLNEFYLLMNLKLYLTNNVDMFVMMTMMMIVLINKELKVVMNI